MTRDLPIVNWPREGGSYKVIQLKRFEDSLKYLRFGRNLDSKDDFHTNILRRFSIEANIETIPSTDPDGKSLLILPEDSPYELIGAGKCIVEFRDDKKFARFYGKSFGYDLPLNKEHLEELAKEFKDWEFI
jgi:hypothetical protein